MKKSVLILIGIIFIFLGTSARGNYPADQNGEVSASPDGPVSGSGGALLSMDIRGEPLKKVLERISDQTGVTFLLPPSLEEEKVMMRLSNLTLEEGLSKILSPYNRMFIYGVPRHPSASSVARLQEVRIFPYEYEGRRKESLTRIAEGASESKGEGGLKSAGEDTGKSVGAYGRREKTYIEDLATTLQGGDQEAKLDAVKVLKDAGTVDAVKALSFAIRDKDSRVQNEAVSALRVIGEELKAVADTAGRIVPESADEDGEKEDTAGDQKPEQGPPPTLRVSLNSGNSANIDLSNEVKVGGVQFKVRGTELTDVRTTDRTEGFLATFDQKSGTVILAGISGKTIAPGNGPIIELVHSGGRVNISGKQYATKP